MDKKETPRRDPVGEAAQEPKKIKNRDVLLLSRVLYIMQDICSLEKRRAWEQERMLNITQQLTGMPGVKGGIPRGLDAAFAAIDGLHEEHRAQVASYVRELKMAEKMINAIPSRTMRTFAVMLYVDNLPDITVRRELNMTEYGFRRAKEAIEQAPDMQSVVWRERYILVQDE